MLDIKGRSLKHYCMGRKEGDNREGTAGVYGVATSPCHKDIE